MQQMLGPVTLLNKWTVIIVNEILERIDSAVKQYQEAISMHFEDGVPHWARYNVTRKIAQAACNYGGYIVTGTRHYCPIMHMQIDAIGHDALLEYAGGHDNVIQGFTDQYGIFLTRQEAYIVARDAGQLLPRHDYGETLFSESYI